MEVSGVRLRDIWPPVYHGPPRERVPLWKRRLTAIPKDEEAKVRKMAVLDIETGKPGDASALGGTFVVGQARYDDERGTHYVTFWSVAEILRWLLAKGRRGYAVYAHNGAGYDYLYLMQEYVSHMEEYENTRVEIILNGVQRAMAVKFKVGKNNVTLYDTFHFLPVALEKLASTFAPEFPKLKHEWSAGEWFNPESVEDMNYLRRDVDALYAIIGRYRGLLHATFGVNCRITSSSNARAAWRRTLEPGAVYWRQTPDVEAFTRRAAHGGLIGLTTHRPAVHVTQADYHAHYAGNGMRLGVPYGTPAWTGRWVVEVPGCYEATVHVPLDERYPFLMGERGVRRGTLRGVFYSNELSYARSLGYDMHIHRGVIWDSLIYPFNAFLALCEKLEIEHRGNAIGSIAKMLRNSLSGGFAKRPTSERMFSVKPGDTMQGLIPYIDEKTGEILSELMAIRKEKLETSYMHPEWYGWHTAMARIITNKLVRMTGAIYYDTDCAVAPDIEWLLRPELFGDKYGELAIEAVFTMFHAGGPKNYYGILSDGETARSRLKGMPATVYDRQRHIDTLFGAQAEERFISVTGMRALVGGTALQQRHARSYAQLRNSATWEAHEDGTVWARIA